MQVARKDRALWFVLAEEERRAHGIELEDEIAFEQRDGEVWMAITKRRRLIRRMQESPQK